MLEYTTDYRWAENKPFLQATTAKMIERIENNLPTYEHTGSASNICKLYFDFDYHIGGELIYDEEANIYRWTNDWL